MAPILGHGHTTTYIGEKAEAKHTGVRTHAPRAAKSNKHNTLAISPQA